MLGIARVDLQNERPQLLFNFQQAQILAADG